MGDERSALVVMLDCHRVKVRLPLDLAKTYDYLEAADRDAWIDDYLELNADCYEIETALVQGYEIRSADYDGPESTDGLPPRVHRDQLSIEVDA